MGEAKFRARRSATPGTTAISSLLKRTSLRDTSRDNTSSAMAAAPRFLRHDPAALASIRALPRAGNLVLFTPVVAPAPEQLSEGGPVQGPGQEDGESSSDDDDLPMDPFEPLGRALSRHHSRVRHVPYVPSVGMTSTHRAFLTHAAAVVVVTVCNAPSAGGTDHQDRRYHASNGGSGSAGRPVSSSGASGASSGFAAQQQQKAPGGHHHPAYRSPYAALPHHRPSADGKASSSASASPYYRSSTSSGRDPAFKFATQAMFASWEQRQQRRGNAGEHDEARTIPTVLVVVDDADYDVGSVGTAEQLDSIAETMGFSGGSGVGAVLRSGSYSKRALGRVAEMVFGADG